MAEVKHLTGNSPPRDGKRLPIVGYSEIGHDGLLVTAAVTCVEDGMWKSDVMRLPAYTAAEIREGMANGDPPRTIRQMFGRGENGSGAGGDDPETGQRRRRIAAALQEHGIAPWTGSRATELTGNARAVLDRRYVSKDREGVPLENHDGIFRRVACNLSQAELKYGASKEERQGVEEEFYRAMRRLELLPNSPTLMNAGRELQQLSACFVLPVHDSLESIFDEVKQTALIHQSGGGTGFSFSRLRPEGDLVGSTGGVASGPVSFIRAFDTATEVIKQGGTRRGANMGILEVTHPDILRFIRAKEDGLHLNNFNLSVSVNTDFMERVKAGEDYGLVNPRTGKVTGQLNARHVFELISELAWQTGDPGILFMDRINQDNPNPQLGRIESTNPCVTGDTLVMTLEGPRTAKSLVGRPQVLLVDGKAHETGPQGFFSAGAKPVVRITTKSGRSLKLTADHLVARAEYEPYGSEPKRHWAKAGELSPGDQLSLHDHVEAHMGKEETQHQREARDSLARAFGNENIVINPRKDNPEIYLRGLNDESARTAQAQLAYLGIQSDVRVTAGSNEPELELRGENVVTFVLRVSRHEEAKKFYLRQLAEIVLQAKPESIQRKPITDQVESVEPAGEQEVYDVQVPGVNVFDANGFYVHNCGELPMLPHESCNLASVNLARMVKHEDGGAAVDWERLDRTVRTAVHLLDNVIDMNRYPVPEIKEMSRKTRRIGVGVMGLADLLIQLGIRYDSEEGLEAAEDVMRHLRDETRRASSTTARIPSPCGTRPPRPSRPPGASASSPEPPAASSPSSP